MKPIGRTRKLSFWKKKKKVFNLKPEVEKKKKKKINLK